MLVKKRRPLAAVSLMVLLILKLLFAFALESEWISWALLIKLDIPVSVEVRVAQ
jgi:hypothetical protein